jgi:FKBP-type peptidyl-prolyl cis-trans isomerase FkpA
MRMLKISMRLPALLLMLACSSGCGVAHAMPEDLEISEQAAGEGQAVTKGWFAVIHYTGWIYDENAADHKGVKFVSTKDRGEPTAFIYGYKRALPGVEKGMEGMKVGARRTLAIPPKFAFRGGRQQPPEGVSRDATLLIEVELLDVVPQSNLSGPDR